MGICPLLLGWRVGACVYALTVERNVCICYVFRGSMFDTLCMYVFAYMQAHVCMYSDVALA